MLQTVDTHNGCLGICYGTQMAGDFEPSSMRFINDSGHNLRIGVTIQFQPRRALIGPIRSRRLVLARSDSGFVIGPLPPGPVM